MIYYCYYNSNTGKWSPKAYKRLGDLKSHIRVTGALCYWGTTKKKEKEINTFLEDITFYELSPEGMNRRFFLKLEDNEWVLIHD